MRRSEERMLRPPKEGVLDERGAFSGRDAPGALAVPESSEAVETRRLGGGG
jgi:hypothetical protein